MKTARVVDEHVRGPWKSIVVTAVFSCFHAVVEREVSFDTCQNVAAFHGPAFPPLDLFLDQITMLFVFDHKLYLNGYSSDYCQL